MDAFKKFLYSYLVNFPDLAVLIEVDGSIEVRDHLRQANATQTKLCGTLQATAQHGPAESAHVPTGFLGVSRQATV